MTDSETTRAEQARLAALRASGALDTGAEERFDRYTRLAQRIFGTEFAQVCLVDQDHLQVKSSLGNLPDRIAREDSYCARTILSDEVLVATDTASDERLAGSPLVERIRFYAGCPLYSVDGFRIGALSVADSAPRSFDADDIAALRDLAAMVSAELSTMRLCTLDDLTALSNRRGFMMIADQSLQICRRSNRKASLLLLDIDGFSKINDKFGVASGDQALSEMARLLTLSFRESDVIGRLGKDTYAVLLTDADFETAWVSVERFRRLLDTMNDAPARRYRLSISAAVVQYDPDRHDSLVRLLDEATVMMHERKRPKPLPRRGA